MAETIRVLIADDHERFRRGLRMVLEAEDGLEVVAEAGDGAEAVQKVEDEAPDVVLMDVRMPNVNGIEATRTIRETSPSTRIIMLTVSDEEDDLLDAVRAGATGYLLKEVSIEEVADAVRAVVGGQSLISPSMAAKLLSEFGAAGATPGLTDRELQVLKRVATGMGDAEIAADLGLSPATIRNHVGNILEKLRMRAMIDAALHAVQTPERDR